MDSLMEIRNENEKKKIYKTILHNDNIVNFTLKAKEEVVSICTLIFFIYEYKYRQEYSKSVSLKCQKIKKEPTRELNHPQDCVR